MNLRDREIINAKSKICAIDRMASASKKCEECIAYIMCVYSIAVCDVKFRCITYREL